MLNLKAPKDRESFAVRLARAAQELAAVRGELERLSGQPYEGAGTTLLDTEARALDALTMGADDVQRALFSLAERLDRDLASKV